MKKRNQRYRIAFCLLAAFVLWTVAVCQVDVQEVGPQGSAVGFASLNLTVHRLTGVHRPLYNITDWLGLVPILFVLGFALLGLVQWIQRKDIRKVDRSLLVLGGFYLAVAAVYVFFEIVIVNYRPVWIEGFPEASYPSSTTVLVLCVMPTAWMQLHRRIQAVGFMGNLLVHGLHGGGQADFRRTLVHRHHWRRFAQRGACDAVSQRCLV